MDKKIKRPNIFRVFTQDYHLTFNISKTLKATQNLFLTTIVDLDVLNNFPSSTFLISTKENYPQV